MNQTSTTLTAEDGTTYTLTLDGGRLFLTASAVPMPLASEEVVIADWSASCLAAEAASVAAEALAARKARRAAHASAMRHIARTCGA